MAYSVSSKKFHFRMMMCIFSCNSIGPLSFIVIVSFGRGFFEMTESMNIKFKINVR